MKNGTIGDKLVLRLFEALSEYLEESEPVLTLCRQNRGARKRQGFTFTPARNFIAIPEIPIRNRLEFVIFTQNEQIHKLHKKIALGQNTPGCGRTLFRKEGGALIANLSPE